MGYFTHIWQDYLNPSKRSYFLMFLVIMLVALTIMTIQIGKKTDISNCTTGILSLLGLVFLTFFKMTEKERQHDEGNVF